MDEIEVLTTKRFESEIQFKEFEKKLDTLIYSEKLKYLDSENFRDIKFRKYIDSENRIYCLSEPDLYWRGFFLNYDSSIIYIKNFKKLDKRNSAGCITFLLILILLIIISVIFK
ncbi:MAG: hypothetical protein E2600_05695 [Chryseobacterium sp.]|nr:hypothetical protein [Chryseobacterium sp.]